MLHLAYCFTMYIVKILNFNQGLCDFIDNIIMHKIIMYETAIALL